MYGTHIYSNRLADLLVDFPCEDKEKLSNKTDYPIRCTRYGTHIYSNRLADLPVDDSRISPDILVDSEL
jgi:hypothetical protein